MELTMHILYVSIHLMQRGWFESEPLTRSCLNRLGNVTKGAQRKLNIGHWPLAQLVSRVPVSAEKSVEIIYYSKKVTLNYAKCNTHQVNIV